jgi:hypothetical protein
LRSPEYSKLFANLTNGEQWLQRTPDRGSVLQAAVS